MTQSWGEGGFFSVTLYDFQKGGGGSPPAPPRALLIIGSAKLSKRMLYIGNFVVYNKKH